MAHNGIAQIKLNVCSRIKNSRLNCQHGVKKVTNEQENRNKEKAT